MTGVFENRYERRALERVCEVMVWKCTTEMGNTVLSTFQDDVGDDRMVKMI